MKDRLLIDEHRGVYHIVWYIAEDDCHGASLGDCPEIDGNDEHAVASRAAKDCSPDGVSEYRGFYWESRNKAQAALRAANVALKIARDNTPWPEWAKQALAAGWKAPKGWRP
jgi:hypothetical protein